MKYCPICAKNYDDTAEVCELDGATLRMSRPKQDSLINKVIKGRYRVLKKLGEGGMGTVYLADQFAINRKVALKIIHPDYARDEDFVKRFRQEATLAASLSHHNVVTVFDFDQADDGSLYIVMEYVDGRSLGEVIQDNPIDVGSALQLGVQIAEGLSAAHRAGVIHRDIKPENIMVVEGGRAIKLMDFGIARLRDSTATTRLTQAGMIMGTPAYMAPEQIEGGELSERTDIYAFGIVLYEMLTGRVPFKAPTPGAVLIKHLHEAPTPLSKVRKEIPSSVEQIVIQALQKSPEKRLRDMEEVVAALKKAQRAIEQSSTDGAQPMAVVWRALGAVALPFRKFLQKTASDSQAAKRNEEPELDAVAHPQRKTPPKVEDIPVTGLREPPRAPRLDSSETVLQRSERQIHDDKTESRQSTRIAEDAPKVSAPSPTETVAETMALTQLVGVQEQTIQARETLEHSKIEAETSIGQKPPSMQDAHASTAAALASPHADDWGVVARPQRHEARLPNRPVQQEQKSTVATEMMTPSSTSLANETIAETVTFTQPTEKVTTHKRIWPVATLITVFAISIGVAGGVAMLRYLGTGSPTSTVKIEEPKMTESAPLLPPIESPAPLEEKQKVEEPRLREVPVLPAPEIKAKESPVLKRNREREREIAAVKPVEKRPPSSSGSATLKRPDSKITKETDSQQQPKPARPDQEQKHDPTAVVELEAAKKLDSTSKKAQEPSPDSPIASLKKPEAPSPSPIAPVVLRSLSIITNRRDLKVKERLPLIVKGRYSDGKETEITGGVQWKSSDTGVAFVNSRGEIEALKEGKAQISATYDGVGSGVYIFNVKGSEDIPKTEEAGEQIKDLRRRMLR
jgi:serine/threonine protein kinase